MLLNWHYKPRESRALLFHGFLISRAREIENDAFHGHFTGISRAFHGLILKFHGHFTGYFLNFKTFSRCFHRNKHKQSSSRTLESRTSSDTGMHAGLRPTRAVLLGLIACHRIKCFPVLIFVIGTIETRACLYVTC